LVVVVVRPNIVLIIRVRRVAVVPVVVLPVLDLIIMVVYTVRVHRDKATTGGIRVVTGTWVAVVVPVQ
jgi:hypothetical protein|tara:strand:- start:195 stop:398 length:204 start_codon:yes stop_codon:yes gene_type:complete